MEIKQVLLLMREWFWLMALGLILGLAGGIVFSILQKPVYEASTKILVTRDRQDTNSDFAYLSDQQLVSTYIEMITTRRIIDAASQKINFQIKPADMLTVAKVGDTQIIQITAASTDPKLAVKIANTLVDTLVEQNEKLQADRYTAMESSINLRVQQVESQMNTLSTEFDKISQKDVADQLAQVEQQIKDISDQISTLQTEISKTTNSTDLNEKRTRLAQLEPLLQSYQQIRTNLLFLGTPSQVGTPREDSRIVKLQSTLNLYQQLYLTLLNNLESLRLLRLQFTPNIAQLEEAVIPDTPVRPNKVINAVLGGMIGAILAMAAITFIELFDDTLKSPIEIEKILGLPTLGLIPEFGGRKKNQSGAFVKLNSKSPVSEAFRLLRARISLQIGEKPINTILVVSPKARDGKTTVAINLAASLSLLGRKVTLIDANIRDPHLHKSLGIDNSIGLGDILSSELDVAKATQTLNEFNTVSAVTVGSHLDSPTETLESDRLSMVLRKLSERADLLILDGPSLATADALAFASRVDGVLLVVRPGHTRIAEAQAAAAYIQGAGTQILGVVLNRIPRNWAEHHEGFDLSPKG